MSKGIITQAMPTETQCVKLNFRTIRKLFKMHLIITWQQDNAHRPEHLHPTEYVLTVLGGLKLAQVWETNSHRTGNTLNDLFETL